MPAFKDFVEANPSADLTDGDVVKFAMLDTGENAEATLTAVAAAPAFAAQYAPLEDSIFIPAALLDSTGGAALATSEFVARVMAYDGTNQERATAPVIAPPGWGTGNVDVYVWWINMTAGAGDVKWETQIGQVETGVTLQLKSSRSAVGTAGAQNVTVRTLIASNVDEGIASDTLSVVRLTRVAADGGDTLAGDAGVHLIEIRKTGT